jgi:uncharacterized protein
VKMRSLKVPVLLIHGLNDSGIPASMSQQLFDVAPSKKQLLFVPDGEHARIYHPQHSYLQVVWQFFGNR